METIFSLSNLLVMPFWLLMILLPHWRWTKRIMRSLWTVVPAALLYALLAVPSLPALLGKLANPSLSTIAPLLGTPEGATIAWIHFLAFDLFVGDGPISIVESAISPPGLFRPFCSSF